MDLISSWHFGAAWPMGVRQTGGIEIRKGVVEVYAVPSFADPAHVFDDSGKESRVTESDLDFVIHIPSHSRLPHVISSLNRLMRTKRRAAPLAIPICC